MGINHFLLSLKLFFFFILEEKGLPNVLKLKKHTQTKNESPHSAWFLQRFLNRQVALISTAMI